MARVTPPIGTATEPAVTDGQAWRLCYLVGVFVHYTE